MYMPTYDICPDNEKNFKIKEEFPKLQPLTGTKGSDVFEAINKVISECTSFERWTGIFADGAKSMVGSNTGLVGHLKRLGVTCEHLHCTIHQKALCGKIIKMNQTMKMVVNIVNLIREGNTARRHREIGCRLW
jgi:hypothetical protein